jgi:hypothetical protein
MGDIQCKRERVTVKQAAYDVTEAVYLKASANGTLPAKAAGVMYAARGTIQVGPESRPVLADSGGIYGDLVTTGLSHECHGSAIFSRYPFAVIFERGSPPTHA